MTEYTVITNPAGIIKSIRRGDGVYIPESNDNADYQRYLQDVASHGAYPVEVIPDPVISPSFEETITDQLSALNAVVLDIILGGA